MPAAASDASTAAVDSDEIWADEASEEDFTYCTFTVATVVSVGSEIRLLDLTAGGK